MCGRILERLALKPAHLRAGWQCVAGVLLVMGALSTPVVWEALSMNLYFVNPMLIIMFLCIILLVQSQAQQSCSHLVVNVLMGAVAGVGSALAVQYLTLLANGGTYDNSLTKACVLLALSCPYMFWVTALRFSRPQWTLAGLLCSLVFSLSVCGNYRAATAKVWRMPLFLLMYISIASAVALLVALFVVPTPAGRFARAALAAGLSTAGATAVGAVAVLTGEVNPATGLLAAAQGQDAPGVGVDAGLLNDVLPIHLGATLAGVQIESALTYIASAKFEVDILRPTHVLPFSPFLKLQILARSLLSSCTMLLYPIQSGQLHVRLCRKHSDQLRGVASAIQACCDAVAASLATNQPIAAALVRLEELHAAITALVLTAHRLPAELANDLDVMSFKTIVPLLFAVMDRLRKIYLLLPGALAKDQPQAGGQVQRFFDDIPDWGLPGRQLIPDSPVGSRQAGDIFRTTIASSSEPDTSDARTALMDRLQTHSVALATVEERTRAMPRRLASRAMRALGVRGQHLRLGVQMTLAFFIVMLFEIIDPIYAHLYQKPVWAMIITVVIFERSVGAMIFKAMLRVIGTLIGAAAGISILYFTVLCNGLNYDNHPQKFILTSILLSAVCGVYAVGAARWPRHAYLFMTCCLVSAGTSLPGYTLSDVQWRLALWRILLTLLGVAVHFVSIMVFPVTSADLLRKRMADSLGQLSSVAEATLAGSFERRVEKQSEPDGRGRRRSWRRAMRRLQLPGVPELLQDSEDLFGPHYCNFVRIAYQASSSVAQMAPLIAGLAFEYYPTRILHRLSSQNMFYCQRLCRHILNVLSAFTSFWDAHGSGRALEDAVAHANPAGHKRQLRNFAVQSGQALAALQAMLNGDMSVDRALEIVLCMDAHAERLFLLIMLSEEREEPVASPQGEQVMAFLAMIFTFVWATRRLCQALLVTFWGPKSPEARAAAAALVDPAKWATDERLILTAQGLVGMLEVKEVCQSLGDASSSRGGSDRGGGGSSCFEDG